MASPLPRLSLKQLALISAIDDTGSLKGAAETIGLSQPRATKSLQEAEAILQTRLFNRSNRGLTPTPEGDCAIRNAKTVLAQLGTMAHELQGLSSGAGTKLRVGTIMGAVPFVCEIITQQVTRYPNMSVEIYEDTSTELLRLLDRGGVNLVVGRHNVSPTPEKYDVVPFHDEVLKVVANPAHPLIGRSRVGLIDLKDSRWVAYTAGMPMRNLLEQEFKLAGLRFPAMLTETRSALITMALIQNDPKTIAILSGDVADLFVGSGVVKTLPLIFRSKSEPYEVITLRAQALPKQVQLLRKELTAGAQSAS